VETQCRWTLPAPAAAHPARPGQHFARGELPRQASVFDPDRPERLQPRLRPRSHRPPRGTRTRRRPAEPAAALSRDYRVVRDGWLRPVAPGSFRTGPRWPGGLRLAAPREPGP